MTIPEAVAKRNLERGAQLHPLLQKLVQGMISEGLLFSITTAHRGKTDQAIAKAQGNSRADFGQSPHNYVPALAMDVYPLIGPDLIVDVNNAKALDDFAPKVKAVALKLGIAITWGGDWHSIIDRPHFELTNWKAIRGKPA